MHIGRENEGGDCRMRAEPPGIVGCTRTGVRGSVRIAETGRYMGRDVIEGGENHYIIDLPQIGLPSKYESSKGKAE